MSELSISRTPDLIAAEINNIKEQTRRQVLYNSIEIGRKLTEAKILVHHGEWGKWLQEKVEYSKSTANNLMKIFEEYGSAQITLLGDNAKSQALGDLSYTQAITLLSISNSEEREEFVEKNNIDEMSTRELKQAIDEMNKAKEKNEIAEKKLAEYKNKSKEEKEKLKKVEAENKKLSEELTRTSDKLLNDLRNKDNEALEAKKEVEECKNKIRELEERPIEVTGIETDSNKIKEIEEDHRIELEKLKNEKEEAEKKLKELEIKENKQNDNIIKYRVYFDELVGNFKNILGELNGIRQSDPEEYEKYSGACKSLINKMLERV